MTTNNDNFHLKKEFTWGYIITMIVIIGGMYADNEHQHQLADKRISVNEINIINEHDQMLQVRTSVDSRLTTIDRKLDRLLEHMIKGGK